MLILAIFVVMVVLICINVPIAIALAMAGVIGLAVSEGTQSLVNVALDMYGGSKNFSLIAIPMFVLAGAIMNAGGITDKLINFVTALIGFIRGVSTSHPACFWRGFRARPWRMWRRWGRS